MYVYIRSERNLWTVGFYKPSGEWYAESDYSTPEEAAERVHWLNGGSLPQDVYVEEHEQMGYPHEKPESVPFGRIP